MEELVAPYELRFNSFLGVPTLRIVDLISRKSVGTIILKEFTPLGQLEFISAEARPEFAEEIRSRRERYNAEGLMVEPRNLNDANGYMLIGEDSGIGTYVVQYFHTDVKLPSSDRERGFPIHELQVYSSGKDSLIRVADVYKENIFIGPENFKVRGLAHTVHSGNKSDVYRNVNAKLRNNFRSNDAELLKSRSRETRKMTPNCVMPISDPIRGFGHFVIWGHIN